MQYCRHTLFSNIGLKLKNAFGGCHILYLMNQINPRFQHRRERDMTLNIPACECQIHLCFRERKKESISIFAQRKQKPYKKSFKMCFNTFEKKRTGFSKIKKFWKMQEAIRVNQLKQSGEKNINHNPRYLYLRGFSTHTVYTFVQWNRGSNVCINRHWPGNYFWSQWKLSCPCAHMYTEFYLKNSCNFLWRINPVISA